MRTLLCFFLACTQAAAIAATPLDDGQAAQLKSDIVGEYRLEGGRNVRLWLIEDRLYIDLNGSYRKELRPVAPNLLASRDGVLTVEWLPDSGTERIRIRHENYPPQRRLGAALDRILKRGRRVHRSPVNEPVQGWRASRHTVQFPACPCFAPYCIIGVRHCDNVNTVATPRRGPTGRAKLIQCDMAPIPRPRGITMRRT